MQISELIESLKELLDRGIDAEVKVVTGYRELYEIVDVSMSINNGVRILVEYYDTIESDETLTAD